MTIRRAGATASLAILALFASACQDATGPAPQTASPTPILPDPSPPSPVPIGATPPPSAQVSPSETVPPPQNVPLTLTELQSALPLSFEGTFEESEFGSHPMALFIERMQAETFSGQLHWPAFDTITAVVGEVVTDFESGPWESIDGFSPEGGIGFAFTETEYLSGNGTLLGGWYYGVLQSDGTMRGVWVPDKESLNVEGSFLIIYSLERQPE